MKSIFEQMIGVKIPCDYGWGDEGIVRIGAKHDVAAYASGDFRGKCVIFLHGNGETAISERELYVALGKSGISVVAPDYRGYGLTAGEFSEKGCYEVAHAAYRWLVDEKYVKPEYIIQLGYSLGSGVAVELAATERVGGLILQAPYYSGRELLPYWVMRFGYGHKHKWRYFPYAYKLWLKFQVRSERSFPTDCRLDKITCPTLIFHGMDDMIIPYSHGKKVFDGISSSRKELESVQGGGHNNFQFVMGYENYVRRIVEFCNQKSLEETKT